MLSVTYWVSDCPSNSPDLNAIEHVWPWMVHMVKQSRPTPHDDLKQAILDAWNQITLAGLGRYCNHIASVLPKIIESNGKLQCTTSRIALHFDVLLRQELIL